MATFLSSGLLLAALLQAPPAPNDSLRAAWWARVAADSTDATAWLGLGRAYLRRARDYHAHGASGIDSVAARAALDSAEQTLERAARMSGDTPAGDSARVLQLFTHGERGYLEWEAMGADAATAVWTRIPATLRLPPVLEELGENLLRACPQRGILFTAQDVDTHAAWYMRFSRGLRPDLVVVPLARWRGDSVFRRRLLRAELQDVPRPVSLRSLGQSRALCASMGFERPPQPPGATGGELSWNKRPLVWVAGRERRGDRVPAQDFVFAALRLAVDQQETWTAPALTLYRRAADNVSDLCRPLRTFGLRDEVGC
ncbi:MAG: hypothetical protein ACREMN_11955 [Gemmatimonadales bacterium]